MSDMRPQGIPNGPESAYEHDDVSIKPIVNSMLIVGTTTLVVMAAMYGMNNFMAHYYDRRDAALVAQQSVYARPQMIPPEPRLLPNPHTDNQAEIEVLKKRMAATGQRPVLRDGEKLPVLTRDRLPWDKRNDEIVDQDDETNEAVKGKSIPVAAAMALDAGAPLGKGTPGVMPWQQSYPIRTAGTQGAGMNLSQDSKEARLQPSIFEHRAYWDSPDEKFTADSAGGLTLKPNAGGKNWSR